MLRVVATFLLGVLLATQSAAQGISIGNLTDRQGAMVRDRIAEGGRPDLLLRRFIPYFQVPVAREERTRCVMQGGLTCWLVTAPAARCPTHVEVVVQGSNQRARVPVNCVGPNLDGYCDCEFATQ